MKRIAVPAALILALIFAFAPACAPHGEKPAPTEPVQTASGSEAPEATVLGGFERAVTYPSRGVEVPAVVLMPERRAGEAVPFAVILHGHGGSNEGLARIAEALCGAGVASIRMDFPGCGQSREDFTQNNLTNMKEDTLRAIDYMASEYGLSRENVSLIGFSMGGRISLELIAEGRVSPEKLMLIAPAASTRELINLFGGKTAWESMKREAGERGYAEFDAGIIQRLGPEFFAAIERVEDPTPAAAERFTGDALVVWSRDDTVVPAYVSENAAEKLGARTLVFEYGGHLNGLYSGPDDPALLKMEEEAVRLFTEDGI